MAGEKFISIGHICSDIRPKEHLGGGVSYSSITASRLGMDAHIVTKCPTHPYIDQLKNSGVTVHVLPSKLDTITTFDNQYDLQGKRKQIASGIQESISCSDRKDIPWDLLKDANILAAPVTPIDVDMKLFSDLAKYGSVNIIPQGYFRRIDKDGIVIQQEWKGFEKYLPSTRTVVLSDEDMTINGKLDESLKEKIVNSALLVAMTQGEKGVTIYEKGKQTCHTKAFPLIKEELIDFTGAGDVFATVFIIEMNRKHGDIKAASVAACLFAAIKITGIGGIGIDSIPTQKQITNFSNKNSKRIREYLKSENS